MGSISKDISFEFKSTNSLFQPTSLAEIQQTLRRVAPAWTEDFYVVEDAEEMENGCRIDPKRSTSLFEILHQEAEKQRPYRRKEWESRAAMYLKYGKSVHPFDLENWNASGTITDQQQDLMLFYAYRTKPNLFEQNDLSGHCYSRKLEGIRAEVFMQSLFVELAKCSLPFDYGNVHQFAEFDAKNLDEKEQVVGIRWQQQLPGLYWLNYFGPLYCAAIGKERLLSAPGKWVKELPFGVVIALGDSPDDWNTSEYRQRCAAVEEHLGKQFFFNINDPHRQTWAPPFPGQAGTL